VVPAAWEIVVILSSPAVSSRRRVEHASPTISPATQT
jgi:hypothetical protein